MGVRRLPFVPCGAWCRRRLSQRDAAEALRAVTLTGGGWVPRPSRSAVLVPQVRAIARGARPVGDNAAAGSKTLALASVFEFFTRARSAHLRPHLCGAAVAGPGDDLSAGIRGEAQAALLVDELEAGREDPAEGEGVLPALGFVRRAALLGGGRAAARIRQAGPALHVPQPAERTRQREQRAGSGGCARAGVSGRARGGAGE